MPDDLPLKVDVAELGRKIARLERRVEELETCCAELRRKTERPKLA